MMSCNKDPKDIGLTDWGRQHGRSKKMATACESYCIAAFNLRHSPSPPMFWVSFYFLHGLYDDISPSSSWWRFSMILSRNMHHQLSALFFFSVPLLFRSWLWWSDWAHKSCLQVYDALCLLLTTWRSNTFFPVSFSLNPFPFPISQRWIKVNKHMSDLHDGETHFCLKAFSFPLFAFIYILCWSALFIFN